MQINRAKIPDLTSDWPYLAQGCMQMFADELDHMIPNMPFAPFPNPFFSTNQKPEKSDMADFWALLHRSEHSRTQLVCMQINWDKFVIWAYSITHENVWSRTNFIHIFVSFCMIVQTEIVAEDLRVSGRNMMHGGLLFTYRLVTCSPANIPLGRVLIALEDKSLFRR